MELLVVLILVALLAGIAVPVVTPAVSRAEHAALRQDLFVMRKAIDDYYADHGRYPPDLAALVERRYIRTVPLDPLTGSRATWAVERDDQARRDGGVINVRSGAPGRDQSGVPYAEW